MSAINEVEDNEKNHPLAEEPKDLEKYNSKKIKLLYLITVGAVLLIVILVAIIVIFIGGKNKNSENKKDKDILDSYFELIYDTTNDDQGTKLFNENFVDKISLMIIDNTTVNISNIYQFDGIGKHKVVIEIFKNIESTEEIFIDINNLISINFDNFKSENLKNISGMFYNCISLTSLNLTSFNAKKSNKYESFILLLYFIK